MKAKLFDEFCLGVNYWPSRTGINIWKDWRPEEIDRDFALMAATGVRVVRMFLVWDDFQPVKEWYGGYRRLKTRICFRHDDSATIERHPSMVDPVMLGRFEEMLEIARRHGLKLMPTLLTGWMSGTFVEPSFLDGRNMYHDPSILRYEALYLGHVAEHFRGHPAIAAWDLGNEDNNCQACPSSDAAWLWTNYMVTTLKRHDPGTPVTSGMHGLGMSRYNDSRTWLIQDVAQSCDFTAPHAYPGFYSDCVDDICSLRPSLLATFLSKLYSGIGGKPAMCQEFGNLGNSVMSEEVAARFLRVNLHSLLANGDLGLLWWSFGDFACIDRMPYANAQMECDGLGLYDVDGRAKPAALEMKAFSTFLEKVDFAAHIPERSRAAIVVPFREIPGDQSKIYMAFILAVQAGLTVDIVRPEADLSTYDLLIVPSCSGYNPFRTEDWASLRERVSEGAVLYLSYDGCSIREMGATFGFRIEQKEKPRSGTRSLTFGGVLAGMPEGETIELPGSGVDWTLDLRPEDGQVLATGAEGRPGLIVNDFGKGKTLFCLEPVEKLHIGVPHVFETSPAWRIFAAAKELAGIDSGLVVNDPHVQRTVARMGDAHVVTVINHSSQSVSTEVELRLPTGAIAELSGDEEIDLSDQAASGIWPLELGPSEVKVYRIEGPA